MAPDAYIKRARFHSVNHLCFLTHCSEFLSKTYVLVLDVQTIKENIRFQNQNIYLILNTLKQSQFSNPVFDYFRCPTPERYNSIKYYMPKILLTAHIFELKVYFSLHNLENKNRTNNDLKMNHHMHYPQARISFLKTGNKEIVKPILHYKIKE